VTELEDADPLTPDHVEPDPEEPFLLLYTSGTTASPKGVPHPYRTILSNARLSANEHRLTAGDRILSPAPFSHLYGLYSLHCAWAVGACTVLLPAFRPEDLASVVQNERPTALWTAPAHVAACRAAGCSTITTGPRSSSPSCPARSLLPRWSGNSPPPFRNAQ